MNLIRAAAVLVALLLSATAALAKDGDGNFAVKGIGGLPCKLLGAALEKKAEARYLLAGWIQGYVAAYNKHVPETYDITPFESDALLLLMMRHHCDSNPDHRLLLVLDSILAHLHADRVPKRSQIVRIDVDKQAIMLYVETIRKMQAQLARRGHYDGAISGQFTEETKSALGAYQTEAGIAPTGFPDQRTLWRLLRPEQEPAK